MSDDSSKPVPWSVWLAIILVLLTYFVSQFAAGILVSIYPWLQHWTNTRANDWLTNSVPAQFFYTLLAEAFTVGIVYWFIRHYKTAWAAIGLKRPRWLDPGIGLLSFPVYLVVYVALVSIASKIFPGLNISQSQDIGFTSVHGFVQLSLTFISLVILPPLAEEILVRGFLFTSLKKGLPVVGAAIITSLVFAAAHLPEGGSAGPLWIAAIDTFTLSLVLCYLRQKTGSLWAGITLHALKNGVAFVTLFLLTNR